MYCVATVIWSVQCTNYDKTIFWTCIMAIPAEIPPLKAAYKLALVLAWSGLVSDELWALFSLSGPLKPWSANQVRLDKAFLEDIFVQVLFNSDVFLQDNLTWHVKMVKLMVWNSLEKVNRSPDMLSCLSDCPTMAYCACTHQYCAIFLMLKNDN